MIRQALVLLTCLLAIAGRVYGQGGDFYSVFGLGEQRRQIGGLYEGMAGTSIAMPTHHGINLTNPALLGMSSLTRLQLGYRFNQHQSTTSTQSLAQNNGGVDGIMGLLGVDTALGIGITFGLEPYTSVDYAATKSLRTIVAGDTITGASIRRGEGGISSIVVGASARVLGRLYAGFIIRSLVGNISMYDDVVALGQGNYNAQQRTSHELRGLIARGGLYWEATPQLSLGAFISRGSDATLRTINQATAIRPGSISLDTTQTSASTTALPYTIGFGASWLEGRTRLGFDVEIDDHTGITVNAPPAVLFGSSLRTSMAIAYQGSRQPGSAYADRIGYSAGLLYERAPFTFNGEPIHDYALELGTNFPVVGAAMVDVGINVGQRTTSAQGALQDLYGRLVVSVSIGEQWFRPFARD